jgi:hypothetical protein
MVEGGMERRNVKRGYMKLTVRQDTREVLA